MKERVLPLFCFLFLFLLSCEEEGDLSKGGSNQLAVSAANGNASGLKRTCASMKVLAAKLKENPELAKKMEEIEEHARAFESAKNGKKRKPGGGGTVPTPYNGTATIPVVVHVIYSKSQENITNTQIQSQIDVLNNDYNAQNGDVSRVPVDFADLVANSNIRFTLASVTRKASGRTSWGTNDEMKFSAYGGEAAWDASHYLNIWVCNIGGGILGYAQFPGGSAATDGVVISPQYFGTRGYVSAPFDKGRTATHEIGHWLNLRHIWGDGGCRRDDFVSDTPDSDRPNYGCPSYPTIHCRTTDMTMNYMDYTDDACMYMFSSGQKDRMRALFASGGIRQSFVLVP